MSSTRVDLQKAFDSAKSIDKMIKAFKEMELSSFQENDLGPQCWKLAHELQKQGGDPEKILFYGKRALNILISDQKGNIPCFGNHARNPSSNESHGCSLLIACTLNLLGYACSKLKRFDESLSYLNWAERNLSKLEGDETCCEECVLLLVHANQFELYMVKTDSGRTDESLIHMKKILGIKERTLEAGCLELGMAYKDVGCAYQMGLNFADALPYQLKALDIYERHLAHDSEELVQLRRHLAVMYADTGDYEKALEQNRLAQGVLKNVDGSSELLEAMVEEGSMLIELGRCEEAVDVLKAVVSHSDTVGGLRATALRYLACAYVALGKFNVAKKHLKIGLKILEKLDINSPDELERETNRVYVAFGFGEIAKVYEKMNDFETAISLSRRVLEVPTLVPNIFLKSSDRLFSMIPKYCKGKQGILALEDLVDKLKAKFGPEHLEVGYGYLNLGVAYLRYNILDLAVKNMLRGKDIQDVCLGPNHLDSLTTSHTIALTYATIGSFDLAIECQEKLIERLKGLEFPTEQDFMEEAVEKLKMMMKEKAKVAESPTRALPESKDAEAESSKCGVSEDKKVPRTGGKQAKSKRRCKVMLVGLKSNAK